MYAIVSLLRRMAANVVYVPAPSPGEDAVVSLTRPATSVGPGVGWGRPSREVRLLSAGTVRSGAVGAAVLTRWENRVYEQLGLGDRMYTLLLGPEEDGPEGRCVRLGIVEGVYGRPSAASEPLRPVPPRRKAAPVSTAPPIFGT
jgi:hypothetical protein